MNEVIMVPAEEFNPRKGQTTPQMFHDFLGILHYFALLRKY